ncbi:2,3-dihydroxybenzoate decarboxylase [Lachnellula arida]|uniref:2,3-dihydroxybenzoate decarboxylase n=1 Tax=Lachnellula arida TaxID=1316785 RepID=A0A8T9BQ11_9HELO|nr:2,3-dihydroxybenzoate decarboxylase [Lachnellula arida]
MPCYYLVFVLSVSVLVGAVPRKWNDTGVGSVIIEEAYSLPQLTELPPSGGDPPLGQTTAQLHANLADIHTQRLASMDATGVDFMVLSCASPCLQGISDPVLADSLMTSVNDETASLISNNSMRFGAFAALSMHNASAAAEELRRTVDGYGFLGALVNDYQQSGSDNATLLYYDQPEYDVFWDAVQELDVPIYFHPRIPVAQVTALDYAHAPWLLGAPHQFAVELSSHVAGLCTNGVFDRFPKLKIIVGHLGERIPSDLWRIDDGLSRKLASGIPMKKPFSSYWKTNIWETTSGNFATDLLHFHTSILGPERILYSVDYPFVTMQQGAEWVDSLRWSEGEKLGFVRGNAIRLLGLDR